LKAWQPILTPKTVLPLFFVIGVIFAPIGGLLYWASSQVQEIRLDYTMCLKDAPTYSPDEDNFKLMPKDKVHTAFKSSNSSVNARWAVEKKVANMTLDRTNTRVEGDRCYIRFSIPEDMGAPVFFYYHLTNFYQNHRRYVESFNADQLKGHARSKSDISGSKCDPLDIDDKGDNATGLPFYPCGLIANSMFNDSFTEPRRLDGRDSDEEFYNMTKKGVAWASDGDLYGDTEYNPEDVVPPPNWEDRYPGGYSKENPPPNLKDWEALHVWMRTAGLPTFSKLYQMNETHDFPEGAYEIVVDYFFPMDDFHGTKSILISTRTVMGGRNPFLGIAYMAVGGVCILLGAIFTVTHLFRPRKLGDHTYLSWNNAPAGKQQQAGSSAAMASGRDIGRAEA
jgi:hypothetical protein